MISSGQYKSSQKNRYLSSSKDRMSKVELIYKKIKMIEIKKYERKPYFNPITNLIKNTEKMLNVSRKDQLPSVSPKKSSNLMVNFYAEDKSADLKNKQDKNKAINSAVQSHRKIIFHNQNLSTIEKSSEDKLPHFNQPSLNQISKINCFKQIMYKTQQFSNQKDKKPQKIKKHFPKKYLLNKSSANRKLKDKRYESEMMEYTNQSINFDRSSQSCLKSSQIRINKSQMQLKRNYNSACSQKPIQIESQLKEVKYIGIHDDCISPW